VEEREEVLRRGAIELVELLVPLRWMCWYCVCCIFGVCWLLEKPLVEEVWVERRRVEFEVFGGEGVVVGIGKMEEEMVREREWEDDEELACWKLLF
jgi:hypothetical protein